MTTVRADRLVNDYLSRLDAAAAALPPQRRVELVAEIREHIHDALGEAGPADEVAIRNVLERLGPPEEIASAAADPTAARVNQRPRVGILEIAALLVLALFPFVGWVVGAILVVLSQAWSARDKIPVLLLPLVLLLGLSAISISSTGAAGAGLGLGRLMEVSLAALLLLGGPVVAVWLAWRSRSHLRT